MKPLLGHPCPRHTYVGVGHPTVHGSWATRAGRGDHYSTSVARKGFEVNKGSHNQHFITTQYLHTHTGGTPYVYMAQLQQPDMCSAPFITPPQVQEIVSPLVVEGWKELQDTHIDRNFVTYILEGISKGYRIGYDYNKKTKKVTSNLLSVSQNPEVVTKYIQKEVALGKMIGPLGPELAAKVHISPFGVIPKGHSGKCHLIVDLSSPAGSMELTPHYVH